MDGFNSDFSAGGSGGKVDTGTIMEQVKVQIAVANAQELLQRMTDKCFKKCIGKPGSTLDNSEQKCIAMCMDRYMDAWNTVSRTYNSRLQRERARMLELELGKVVSRQQPTTTIIIIIIIIIYIMKEDGPSLDDCTVVRNSTSRSHRSNTSVNPWKTNSPTSVSPAGHSSNKPLARELTTSWVDDDPLEWDDQGSHPRAQHRSQAHSPVSRAK
ncbi:hypothetical protein FQN60_012976, partial [Etheostoma spectabile]